MKNAYKCAFALSFITCSWLRSAPASAGWDQTVSQMADKFERQRLTQQFLAAWPENSKLAAQQCLEKYGTPDEATYDRLTWLDRSPWRSMTVYRLPPLSQSAAVLEQTVRYALPVGRWRDLSAFENGVGYDVLKGELKALSDNEDTNILALNVADELVRRSITIEEARGIYEKTLLLRASGKSSRYTRGLMFSPQRTWHVLFWR